MNRIQRNFPIQSICVESSIEIDRYARAVSESHLTLDKVPSLDEVKNANWFSDVRRAYCFKNFKNKLPRGLRC